VILGLNCQSLIAGHKAGPPCNGPAFQHTIEFKPQIEMKAAGIVSLHDKLTALRFADLWLWLGGAAEVTLFAIDLKAAMA